MVSKTKRALALVLTAMMAASALAGCSGGGSNGGNQNSSAGSTGGDATTSGGAASNVESVADIESSSVQEEIKALIAEEAKNNGGNIELKLWCSGDDGPFEKTLVEKFEKEYSTDGVTIDVKVKTSYGEDAAGGKVLESPKEAADVFNMADDQITQLVEAGAIAEIAPTFQANVVKNNSADSIAACSVNDKAYAFPKTSDNGYFMYYDKRVYKSEDEVQSLDDMIKKANDAGKSVYLNITGPWYMTGFFFTAGCEITYDPAGNNGKGKQTATFNTPEGLKAAKAICHIAESKGAGFVGSPSTLTDNAYVQQGFAKGELAAAVIGTWAGPMIKEAIGEENVGAAKLPTILMDGKQEQLHSFGGYKVIGVNSNCKYPVTAQMLAYYLTNKDSQVARYNERGLIPTNNEAVADDKVKNDPALKAINDQLKYAHPQGKSVGGDYWSVKPETMGNEAWDKSGKLTDDEINGILNDIVTQLDSKQ